MEKLINLCLTVTLSVVVDVEVGLWPASHDGASSLAREHTSKNRNVEFCVFGVVFFFFLLPYF